MQHVQGRDLTRVVVDAENVRRSTWPNLSREELVERVRAWAEREDVDPLIVFDGEAPEAAPDLVGSYDRNADDVIAEIEGPFRLVTSDRALRRRVGARAEGIVGGGSFLEELRRVSC